MGSIEFGDVLGLNRFFPVLVRLSLSRSRRHQRQIDRSIDRPGIGELRLKLGGKKVIEFLTKVQIGVEEGISCKISSTKVLINLFQF